MYTRVHKGVYLYVKMFDCVCTVSVLAAVWRRIKALGSAECKTY